MIYPKAIINLNSLEKNIHYLKSLSDTKKIFPVVKANAYGHGVIPIVKKLYSLNITCICVATISEIEKILFEDIGISVLHLGKVCLDKTNTICNKHTIITINSIEDVRIIDKNISFPKTIRCHIKIDTGMNRMGCNIEDFQTIYTEVMQSKILKLEGIYSHLACSDDITSNHNMKQINLFKKITENIDCKTISLHLLNSSGLFNFSKYSFDYIRTGISIYGISPLKCINDKLTPVMQLKAPVIQLKKIIKGDKVGYGCKYVADSNTVIAIIQCGYADGLSKSFENNGYVYFNNNQYPIVGKISMDLIAIDTKDFKFNVLDEVTIWGDGNIKNSQLELISKNHNKIPYEYLTNLSDRVKRIYVDED